MSTTGRRVAAVEEAAQRLVRADQDRVPCNPVRDLIGADDVGAAYEVQGRLADLRRAAGAREVGRKIGLTSAAVQQQLGVDQPDFGMLFDDMRHEDGAVVATERLIQPRIEAGALGPMVPVAAGDSFVADLGGLGTVSVTFASGEGHGA